MRKLVLAALTTVMALLMAGVSYAQNNPYKIDDECYSIYMEASSMATYETRAEAAARMRDLAVDKKDAKAEVMSYVLDFISETRYHGDDEMTVERMAQKVRDVALRSGYDQYYFYTYSQSVVMCLRKFNYVKAIGIAERMLDDAKRMESDYGFWSCYRSFASIYQQRADDRNARKYLLLALDYSSKVPEQSVSRIYYDLADTYKYYNDTTLMYLDKAYESSITIGDTVRSYIGLCTAYGFRSDKDNFYRYKGLFEDIIARHPLQGYDNSDLRKIRLLDDYFRNDFDSFYHRADSMSRDLKFLYIAFHNAAQVTGDYRKAYEMSVAYNDYVINRFSDLSSDDLADIADRLQYGALEREVHLQSARISRITLAAILAGGLLFVGLIAFVLQFALNKARSNRRLLEVSKELEMARDEAVKASGMKTQFIQNMSHEIRTPLNAIVGFSQLLGLPDGLISEEEKNQYVQFIRSNSDMLTMLVDDILNIADMEHGNFHVETSPCSVNAICVNSMNTVQYRVPPGVTLTFTTDADDSLMCTTDERRAQQILINFLTNACKHTEKGSIRLDCSLSANPGKVTFSVSDTGPGVPTDMAEKIFDRFIKLNSFKQGTGLGLHICRQVASRLDGEVFLDTTYSPGARFVFVIPLRQTS